MARPSSHCDDHRCRYEAAEARAAEAEKLAYEVEMEAREWWRWSLAAEGGGGPGGGGSPWGEAEDEDDCEEGQGRDLTGGAATAPATPYVMGGGMDSGDDPYKDQKRTEAEERLSSDHLPSGLLVGAESVVESARTASGRWLKELRDEADAALSEASGGGGGGAPVASAAPPDATGAAGEAPVWVAEAQQQLTEASRRLASAQSQIGPSELAAALERCRRALSSLKDSPHELREVRTLLQRSLVSLRAQAAALDGGGGGDEGGEGERRATPRGAILEAIAELEDTARALKRVAHAVDAALVDTVVLPEAGSLPWLPAVPPMKLPTAKGGGRGRCAGSTGRSMQSAREGAETKATEHAAKLRAHELAAGTEVATDTEAGRFHERMMRPPPAKPAPASPKPTAADTEPQTFLAGAGAQSLLPAIETLVKAKLEAEGESRPMSIFEKMQRRAAQKPPAAPLGHAPTESAKAVQATAEDDEHEI